MSDTAPQTSERVTNTVAPAQDAAAHKEPEIVQADRPAPQVQSTTAMPLDNADNPTKTANDVETTPSTSRKPVLEGEPPRTSIPNVPLDSATPRGEDPPNNPNSGETPLLSSNTVPGGEQAGMNDNASVEQSAMQVDTPPVSNKPLTDELNDGEREIHPPSIPLALPQTQEINLDLLSRIPGLFRLLDLVSDKNIEKIIIDHDSMGAAMNALRDGSYKTISKINFAALDGVSINPVGLYGSKSALTQTLVTLGAVEESIAEHLRQPINRNGQLSPYLRSGIYLFLPPVPDSDAQTASSAVIYVLFMRYRAVLGKHPQGPRAIPTRPPGGKSVVIQ